ncbi:MAG: hypothetical protein IJA15_00855 [Clostridia bacterium]|nr:hypothetical protein [Clostridia bacterium]
MKKFSDYAKNNQTKNGQSEQIQDNQTAFELLNRVASKYEGASESQLLTAIMSEAKKAKANGTLSNNEIENFVATISPMLNQNQRKQLERVIAQIKK